MMVLTSQIDRRERDFLGTWGCPQEWTIFWGADYVEIDMSESKSC